VSTARSLVDWRGDVKWEKHLHRGEEGHRINYGCLLFVNGRNKWHSSASAYLGYTHCTSSLRFAPPPVSPHTGQLFVTRHTTHNTTTNCVNPNRPTSTVTSHVNRAILFTPIGQSDRVLCGLSRRESEIPSRLTVRYFHVGRPRAR